MARNYADVPRKGNVDRNRPRACSSSASPDVPRKGNVDRNITREGIDLTDSMTFPARGTWIEIACRNGLHKNRARRSPQGERG